MEKNEFAPPESGVGAAEFIQVTIEVLSNHMGCKNIKSYNGFFY